MKKIAFALFAMTSLSLFSQNVNIPDGTFKNYLLNYSAINTNYDSEIQVSEANSFNGTILCSGSSINDLTGIEEFINLDKLFCDQNNLTSLDVSQLAQLTFLDCRQNSIVNLDVSQNLIITKVRCDENSLSTLNLANGNNLNFSAFFAMSNPNLTCIQVDDAVWSTANWGSIDAGAYFSEDCGWNVGLAKQPITSGVVIYPNPVINTISLISDGAFEVLNIYSLSGQEVSFQTTSGGLDVALLEPGVYFLRLKIDGDLVVVKFLKV